MWCFVFFSSRRRHTRCALVTGVQTCALPICWLVREGRGTSRRTVRVIVLDAAGAPHALKTTLTQRDDVNDLLANTLADGIKYRNAGFTASLNLATAKVDLDRKRLHLAYDDGSERMLIPVACRSGGRRVGKKYDMLCRYRGAP